MRARRVNCRLCHRRGSINNKVEVLLRQGSVWICVKCVGLVLAAADPRTRKGKE